MGKVLVISGHPDLASSNANRVILKRLEDWSDQVEIRNLDALYPHFEIDIEAEQAAMLQAEIIVLQFPFHWYSVPALLKQWLDKTFSYNFAYGAQGDKLKGKHLVLSFTVGGPETSYTPLGYNHFPILELLKPLEQTAYLAGMNFLPPIFTHRMVYIPDVYNTLEAVEAGANEHAQRLVDQLDTLFNDPQLRIESFVREWFAQFDQLPESSDDFLQHLSPQLELNMPEGSFHGHDGFQQWYALARAQFKPGCQHQVEQLDIKAEDNAATRYRVELRVRLQAKTHADSVFKGQPINLLVNEYWQLSAEAQAEDQANHITIHRYDVVPVTVD